MNIYASGIRVWCGRVQKVRLCPGDLKDLGEGLELTGSQNQEAEGSAQESRK